MGDLPDGRARFDRRHDGRYEVAAVGGHARDPGERLPERPLVAAFPQGAEARQLPGFDLRINTKKGYGPFFGSGHAGKGAVPLFHESVDTDDDGATRIDGLLRTE